MINKLKSSQLTYTTYNITLISIIQHFLETKPNALRPEDCILNCWMNKKLCLYLNFYVQKTSNHSHQLLFFF